jgi:hypothetical protein
MESWEAQNQRIVPQHCSLHALPLSSSGSTRQSLSMSLDAPLDCGVTDFLILTS